MNTNPKENTMSNSVKAGLWSALWAFVASFSIGLFGWIAQVAEWAGSTDGVDFPSVTPLGKAAVAALIAGGTFLLNWGFRAIQAKSNVIPGNGPVYPPTADPAGELQPPEFP